MRIEHMFTETKRTPGALGALAFALAMMCAYFLLLGLHSTKSAQAASITFTVTSTADSKDENPGDAKCFTGEVSAEGDECTLRAAIEEANAFPGKNTINFNIPGTGVATISPASALDTISDPLTIDGYSQPGAKPNTLAVGSDAVLKIELSGASQGVGGHGLQISAANSTVKGLIINRCGGAGVIIDGSGATGNKVIGNYIGTDASGKEALGNGSGVVVGTQGNTIGGTEAGARNVISSNHHYGVTVHDSGNRVQGNYIGTDASGKETVGEGGAGVWVEGTDNTIGGTTAGARNVISSNSDGVVLIGQEHKVQGNYIGTDASGKEALGNYSGVSIVDGQDNTIGGTTAGAGNVISRNVVGVDILYGTSDNEIMGNFIGTDVSGTEDLGNYYAGVEVEGTDNTIGGTTAGARNVISGNGPEYFDSGGSYSGVRIGSSGNRVQGNYIGTDASGKEALGNGGYGIWVSWGFGNVIGGTTAGARNVISANAYYGVSVSDLDNRVQGNYIGTDASGKEALGNSLGGVSIVDGQDNTIGGTTAGAGNVISANAYNGVLIYNEYWESMNNKVEGNYIGTDASGKRALGNSRNGVLIRNAPNNAIGGTEAGARNVISANAYNGVAIFGSSADGNKVVGNSIGTDASGKEDLGNSLRGVLLGDGTTGSSILSNSINGNRRLGIDLGNAGVTANDTDDEDGGSNNLQNFPELTSATQASEKTTIEGTLNSTPNTTFTIQFFSSPTADPSGHGEGKKFLGQKRVTTDGSGDATLTLTTKKVPAGQVVSATATNESTSDTSEFSVAVSVS